MPIDLVDTALKVAASWHAGQVRFNGEPYYNHCVRVHELLKKIGAPQNVQIAGILHDILEDTKYRVEDLIEIFGLQVASLVKQCSKKEDGSFDLRDQAAWMIKLCDAFDNCTDVESVKEQRIRSYAKTKRQLFGIA